MAKYLVIVESPAKVKTIKKFLGANYEVAASNGHVRDFPKSQFGIDVEHDYEPKYITIRGKGDILANLRKEVKKAEKIYLATDPDREGEAISWHLMEALKLSGIVKACERNRYEFSGCAAGAPDAGPYGWLSDFPASVGKGEAGTFCRTCAVCCPAHYL